MWLHVISCGSTVSGYWEERHKTVYRWTEIMELGNADKNRWPLPFRSLKTEKPPNDPKDSPLIFIAFFCWLQYPRTRTQQCQCRPRGVGAAILNILWKKITRPLAPATVRWRVGARTHRVLELMSQLTVIEIATGRRSMPPALVPTFTLRREGWIYQG